MPTSATHITVVERVAASNAAMKSLLGDPLADPDTPEGIKMRFAKLGSLGPDIFYAMADYGGDLQDLENFLIKVAGTFECIGELMGKVGRYVKEIEAEISLGITDSIHQTFDLIGGAINEGVLALIVGPAGMNFWPVFESVRQRDLPREKWFWADYLHYIKTGQYVRQLIKNAKGSGDPNLIAYAYGYLTHYVTDVVGHPYVNQVVQGPWRLYWQRHHLVENFMDAYVWDRWHKQNPPPAPPSTEEPPLDTLTSVPNSTGSGAPVTFSRLNDHVNIGNISLGDSVDDLVNAVCEKIEQGLFDIGVAENIEPDAPTEQQFIDWTKYVSHTIKQVYDSRHPHNLDSPSRPGGFPLPDDVAGAYGVFRLVLRISTEEKIKEPQPPDLIGDIEAAAQKLADDLASNLSSFPPLPSISTSGSFSWSSLWDAIKKIAEWVGETLAAVGKTVFDFLKDVLTVALTPIADAVKYALYLLNKALFSIYSTFRDVLVYAGYAIPYTNQLSVDMGGGHNSSILWRSAGNSAKAEYPVEEIAEERERFFSNYGPFVPPNEQPASFDGNHKIFLERPNFNFTAPYDPAPGSTLTPDIFIDSPLGPDDDMFMSSGPEVDVPNADDFAPNSISVSRKNFGGAIANCIKGITLSEANFPGGSLLPDYNLDGDRSYAWPCWDVVTPPVFPTVDPPTNASAPDPLRPESGLDFDFKEAHVNSKTVPA